MRPKRFEIVAFILILLGAVRAAHADELEVFDLNAITQTTIIGQYGEFPITGTVTFDATTASFVNSDIYTVVGDFTEAPFYTSPNSEEVDFGRQVVGITVSEVALYFATPVTATYSGGAVGGFVYSFEGSLSYSFVPGTGSLTPVPVPEVSGIKTGGLALLLGGIAMLRGRGKGRATALFKAK